MAFLDIFKGNIIKDTAGAVGELAKDIKEVITGDPSPDKLAEIAQQAIELQNRINIAEAGHRSLFVAGWRPFIGWICGLAIFYHFLLQPILAGFAVDLPVIALTDLWPVIVGMLGLGAYRTYEKRVGVNDQHD